MNVAYIRVSTAEQNEERQLKAMKGKNIDKYFTEKISAKSADRPKLKELLSFVREGDTVYIHDFSRLARSTKDLLAIFEKLKRKKVTLISNKEHIDTSTPTGKLMLTMLGAIAEFERDNLLERQREGIAIAKEKGAYKKKPKLSATSEEFINAYARYKTRELTKCQLAKELNISRTTLYKIIDEYNNK